MPHNLSKDRRLRSSRGPRTGYEARGRHFFHNHEDNCGIITLLPGLENFVPFKYWILIHFHLGRLHKNVIITWPALGIMGISGPSGVLMLPSGLTALGQHQNSLGARNTHDPTGWGCNNVSFWSAAVIFAL